MKAFCVKKGTECLVKKHGEFVDENLSKVKLKKDYMFFVEQIKVDPRPFFGHFALKPPNRIPLTKENELATEGYYGVDLENKKFDLILIHGSKVTIH